MLPHTEYSLVPVLLGLAAREYFLYHAAPWATMGGTAARVSTLLIVVGWPKTPETAGKGGLIRGLPRRPSIEFIIAVSSPQIYAPAPLWTQMLIVLPVPIAFLPMMPAARASASARSIRSSGSVNSPRM